MPGVVLSNALFATLCALFYAGFSADLIVDVLHKSKASLPRLAAEWVQAMRAEPRTDYPPLYSWRPWILRAFDIAFAAPIVVVSPYVWISGKFPDLGVRAIWALALLVELAWTLYLIRLPGTERKANQTR